MFIIHFAGWGTPEPRSVFNCNKDDAIDNAVIRTIKKEFPKYADMYGVYKPTVGRNNKQIFTVLDNGDEVFEKLCEKCFGWEVLTKAFIEKFYGGFDNIDYEGIYTTEIRDIKYPDGRRYTKIVDYE